MIISQNDHTQKKAMLLQDMHYRNISQRLMLLKRFVNIIITSFCDIYDLLCRTEEAAKYLEATKLQTSNGYSEEFTVMKDLMGLASCILLFVNTVYYCILTSAVFFFKRHTD